MCFEWVVVKESLREGGRDDVEGVVVGGGVVFVVAVGIGWY